MKLDEIDYRRLPSTWTYAIDLAELSCSDQNQALHLYGPLGLLLLTRKVILYQDINANIPFHHLLASQLLAMVETPLRKLKLPTILELKFVLRNG